ncbi:hypothetical protein SAMN05421882_10804 [Nitrosomonas communis]|uniref:Uncharacterized protein n=1 Tax=Nitrosomonas communis TaxID=44574 RepID=A0A1H2ZJQ7_9PROT|nr:hypothetical protein SAMN05421882_10804 [Nitrosomonas communis]
MFTLIETKFFIQASSNLLFNLINMATADFARDLIAEARFSENAKNIRTRNHLKQVGVKK